ncbi:MAG: class I SAM-dependent methyltransferase [Planctomycetes bacterium]|nr:class I SAM-dependent methyltransferase [Planctomycetota bacterium]
MIKYLLKKFAKNPYRFTVHAFSKIVIGPLCYGRAGDYDARGYWHDRLSKYQLSLIGAGDEGLTERENQKVYETAARDFLSLCGKEIPDLKNKKILEIGVGTGYYTRIFHGLGIKKYTGIDITAAVFPRLRRLFPGYLFLEKDVTTDKIDGQFDLIIIIDVIEHIVNKNKLSFALRSLENALAPGGTIIVSPIVPQGRKDLFYVRFWDAGEISAALTKCGIKKLVPFRNGKLAIIRPS